MGKKEQTLVPEGYELLERDTRIKRGDLFLDVVDDPTGSWELTCNPGTRKWCSNLIYCRKIATPVAPKAPAKPKPSKVVWSKKFLNIHPKATKADLAEFLQETVDQLNDIGTKWAKAQNTINTLKKKAAK